MALFIGLFRQSGCYHSAVESTQTESIAVVNDANQFVSCYILDLFLSSLDPNDSCHIYSSRLINSVVLLLNITFFSKEKWRLKCCM